MALSVADRAYVLHPAASCMPGRRSSCASDPALAQAYLGHHER